MAKEELKKKAKPGFPERMKNFFKGIGRGFKNMFNELKKVTWPSKKEVINYSVVVFLFMIVLGIIIGLIDLGSGKLVDLIVNL